VTLIAARRRLRLSTGDVTAESFSTIVQNEPRDLRGFSGSSGGRAYGRVAVSGAVQQLLSLSSNRQSGATGACIFRGGISQVPLSPFFEDLILLSEQRKFSLTLERWLGTRKATQSVTIEKRKL